MSVKCSDCTALNPFYRQRCEVCYKHLYNPEWRCQVASCLYLNPISLKQCSVCGTDHPDSAGKKPQQQSGHLGRKKGSKEELPKKNFLNVGPTADTNKRSHSADNRVSSRWNCCICTYFNNDDVRCCEMCSHVQSTCCDDINGKKWVCQSCQNFNLEQFTRCCYCSKRRIVAIDNKKDKKLGKNKDAKTTKDTTDQDHTKGPKLNDKHSHDHDRKESSPRNADQTWICKRCSFINDNSKQKCGTCEHDKPRVIGFDVDGHQNRKPRRHDIRMSINAKNLRTIRTREVEKEWRSIVLKCQQDKTSFVDQRFPPNDNSLFKQPRPEGSNIEWLRLKDVMDEKGKGPIHWKVYDKPSANDIVQGSIGNCWFICALAVVAERQKLIERIFVTKDYCPEGAYVVRLCKDGSWKTVVLDDYFPVDQHKRLKYSTARRGQLWVPLIEKAAAKIHGCYEALGSGRTVESLSLLTGEPCEHLSLTESKDLSKTIDNILIWSKLTHARDCGYLMCTSCGIPGGFSSEHCKSLGLVTGHAYSLLDVYDLETGEKLLKIRNPWGRESWNGDWNDDSPKWRQVKPEVKQQLKPDGNKDGIFWMEFNEFRKYFKDVDICKTRKWHETRVKGSFPDSANGPWKFVKIYVQQKTDICLGLHQKNKRGNSNNHEDFVDMVIIVMENLNNRKQRTVGCSKRDCKSYVGCDLEGLESGEYTVACLAFKHLNEGRGTSHHQRDFVLTIHSTEGIVVEENDSITAGYIHYLADILIQVAVDKGEYKDLNFNNKSYSLSWNGYIYVMENKDKKKYTSYQQDCRESKNLMSSRGSLFTQDIIPPRHRQVLIVMSTINPRKGSCVFNAISYSSSHYQTLESFGDKTRKHNPDIPRELECLHLPRPIV